MTELPSGARPVDNIGPGTVLRDWRVTAFIARGAYGQVFAAEHVEEPRIRALKVFDPVLSWAARSTLLREFEMLRGPMHAHLLRGDDAFDIQSGPLAGCVVFVLELADLDLATAVARRGPLPAAEVAAIGAVIAGGLDVLHGGGHLHGDVKPANILLVDDAWKLGDFGVSTVLEGSYALASATTLDFRPPELSAAQQSVRVHRGADVWALGVTLWVAATGRHPFVGADSQLRYSAVLRDDRLRGDGMDPRLRELLEGRCLARDPHERATAGDLANDLAELARHGRSAANVRLPPTRPEPGERSREPTAAWEDPSTGRMDTTARIEVPRTVPFRAAGVSLDPAADRSDRRGGIVAALVTAAGAVAATAVVVQVCSLLAARVPGGLTIRRVVYLAAVVVLLVATGGMLQRRYRPGRARLAAAIVGAAIAFVLGTGYLFFLSA